MSGQSGGGGEGWGNGGIGVGDEGGLGRDGKRAKVKMDVRGGNEEQ